MAKNILVDLNVIVDVLLERKGYQAAMAVLGMGEARKLKLHVSAHVVTTLAYLLEVAKVPTPEISRQIAWLITMFIVVPVDATLLEAALVSRLSDYEDAVIEQAALRTGASRIITGNIKDFTHSAVPAMTAADFLSGSH